MIGEYQGTTDGAQTGSGNVSTIGGDGAVDEKKVVTKKTTAPKVKVDQKLGANLIESMADRTK